MPSGAKPQRGDPSFDGRSLRFHLELLSTVEIAWLLGVSHQRVDKLSRSPNFPRPIATLAIGRVWERTDIVTWAKQTERLPADFEA